MPKSSYKLNTLSRALDILEIIESSIDPLSLTEIAGVLKEATPIVYRVLWTLETRGYLHRRQNDKRYVHTGRTTGTGSIRRAISILRVLAETFPYGGSPDEIGERLGLSGEVVVELVGPLIDENIIEPTKTDKRWRLSYSLLEIVKPLIYNNQLIEAVRPLMESLRAKTGETVSLFHRSGSRQIITAVVPSLHPVRYVLNVGESFPLQVGAAGKAALSAMSDSELLSILEENELPQLTQYIPVKNSLEGELKIIRKRGYAISTGERVEGASSVATVIRDVAGEVRAVLGIMMPSFRTTPKGISSLGEMLVVELKAIRIPSLYEKNQN